MVAGVCRRVLGNDADAEDAFQACFLVLAQKAGQVDWRTSVGAWLYNVAYRIASDARRTAFRRRRREQRVSPMPPTNTEGATDWAEVAPILDDELHRLPEQYRLPLLLCGLHGKSREQAAEELGWTAGTVKGRLERGRDLLRARLGRRGIVVSAVALPAVLAQQAAASALPQLWIPGTVHAAVHGTTNVAVLGLMKGALQAMFFAKLRKAGLLAVIAVVALGSGMGVWSFSRHGGMAHAVPLALDKKEEPRPVDEIDQFKAYLAKNHKDAKWQTGPARIDSEVIRTAFPGQRFYYVASNPPLPPGNYISVTVATDGKGVFVPVDFNKGFSRGMMKIVSEDDARTGATAIFAITNPGSASVANNLKVRKTAEGWTCTHVTFLGHDTVQFNPEGKCVGVSRVAPPDAGPDPRPPVPPK
jgi:RNA polymerase sigma factor (sigma-70 family)